MTKQNRFIACRICPHSSAMSRKLSRMFGGINKFFATIKRRLKNSVGIARAGLFTTSRRRSNIFRGLPQRGDISIYKEVFLWRY